MPVLDLDRAAAFYEKVSADELERTQIDGNEMALFTWQDDAPGASGALAKSDSYAPGSAGVRIYFGVERSMPRSVWLSRPGPRSCIR